MTERRDNWMVFDLYELDRLGFSTDVACMFVPLDGASNRVFVGGDMPTQMKSFIQELLQERRTYIIVAAFVKGCPMLHDDTLNLAELAKLANALLRREWDAKKGNFRWNTLHVAPAEDAVSC